MSPYLLRPACGDADLAAVRCLFREYQLGLGIDLCFQNFDQELAMLPGAYAPPRGRLVLAMARVEPAGCVALRPLGKDACEMKRLYVRPAFRGAALGRLLVEHVVAEGRALGYRRMVLDTLPSMAAAQALYRSLGFHQVPPYTDNPVPSEGELGERLDSKAESNFGLSRQELVISENIDKQLFCGRLPQWRSVELCVCPSSTLC